MGRNFHILTKLLEKKLDFSRNKVIGFREYLIYIGCLQVVNTQRFFG